MINSRGTPVPGVGLPAGVGDNVGVGRRVEVDVGVNVAVGVGVSVGVGVKVGGGKAEIKGKLGVASMLTNDASTQPWPSGHEICHQLPVVSRPITRTDSLLLMLATKG